MQSPEIQGRYGIKLEPCPFCHASINIGVFLSRLPHVICMQCGAEGPPSKEREDIVQATIRWNTRIAPKPISYKPERIRGR